MNRLSIEKRTQIISCLVEGCSIRGTARLTGCSKVTITKLLINVGKKCDWFLFNKMVNLPCTRIEVDELWTFCWMKEKRVPDEIKGQLGYGDVYTWTAIDPVTKLMPCFLVGRRDAEHANKFMTDLAWRLKNRVQLTSDGHQPYANAVEIAFGGNVDYAMLVKEYGGARVGYDGKEKKCKSSECSNITTQIICGNPVPEFISTSMVERSNLTVRMCMRRFTRKTNAFSKKIGNLRWAMALHYVYYNFARIHKTLRVTPAMEAGIEKRVWDIEDIVRLAA